MEFVLQQIDKVPGMVSAMSSLNRSKTLSLYNEPPTSEITLDEFELFSLDRLQLLREIEKSRLSSIDAKEFTKRVEQKENKCVPIKTFGPEVESSMRKDQVSHFILRLAFCRTPDLRQWFLEQEVALFRCRLERLKPEERSDFMASNGLTYELTSEAFKVERKDRLCGLGDITESSIYITPIYKIPFQQAIKLFANRSVYLEAGYAYVPMQKLESIIIMKFRGLLSHALAEAFTMFDVVSSDPRIGPLLKNMNNQYVGKDFSKTTAGDLSPDQVDAAADHHMPLCMKALHYNLKREHKLKHWGRLQYGLFLKGAGLGIEGIIQFFETHFGKIMGHDQFVKDYSYSFRHMYGKEGARKNYTPYSCMKIIMGPPPSAVAFHGCPYKHMGDSQLGALLTGMKISTSDVKDMMQLKASGHYQLACQKHFDATHPEHKMYGIKNADGAANHPNGWYLASTSYAKAKAEASGVRVESAPDGVVAVPVSEENSKM